MEEDREQCRSCHCHKPTLCRGGGGTFLSDQINPSSTHISLVPGLVWVGGEVGCGRSENQHWLWWLPERISRSLLLVWWRLKNLDFARGWCKQMTMPGDSLWSSLLESFNTIELDQIKSWIFLKYYHSHWFIHWIFGTINSKTDYQAIVKHIWNRWGRHKMVYL